MRALQTLTVANIKSYVRDRQAVFWTLAFPLIFIFLFGSIFSGGTNTTKLGWADEDQTAQSAQLRAIFGSVPTIALVEGSREDALSKFDHGDLAGVVAIPKGYGATVAAAGAGQGAPANVAVYT